MPVETFVVEQLLGMNRNAAEGATEQQPVELANMVPTRQGGWQVRGLVRRLNSATAYGNYLEVVGYDHAGYSSFYSDAPVDPSNYDRLGVLNLANPNFVNINAYDVTESLSDYVHLPGVGAYSYSLSSSVSGTSAGEESYVVKAKDTNTLVRDATAFRATVTGAAGGGTLPVGNYRVYALTYIRTAGGKLYVDARMWFINLASVGSITASLPGGAPTYIGADIYLGRDPQATVAADMFTKSSGALNKPLEYVLQGSVASSSLEGGQPLTIDEVQFGAPLNVSGYGTPLIARLANTNIGTLSSGAGFYWPLASHNQRIFFNPGEYGYLYTFRWNTGTGAENSGTGGNWQSSIDRYSPVTVAWTEQGALNLFNLTKSHYTLPATNSERITAFTSAEEGLIIWLDNEAFMMRGDPSFAEQADFNFDDFNFRPYLSIGHDRGAPPGLLGNLIYPIWNGEVYQIAGGQAENISRTVYDRTDRFVQVIGDVERNCVLCRTQSGLVFAYYPDDGFWCRIYSSIKLLLPATTDAYAIPDGQNGLLYMARPESAPAEITDETLDEKPLARFRWAFGDKRRLKMLKRIRMYVNRSFSGTVTLTYGVDGVTAPTPITPYRRGDELIFALPLGWVGSQFDVTFAFSRMVAASTIEPPILAEYVNLREKR